MKKSKKKASRIVELAKQAIYHEISTPCDMTSAHKALILVAGPSHESLHERIYDGEEMDRPEHQGT